MEIVGMTITRSQFPIKSTNIDKIHKIHAPKIQGRVFSEKKGACGKHIDHRVFGGSLKSTTIDKIHKMHAPNIQGVFFSEVTEAPQAITTSRTVLGGP